MNPNVWKDTITVYNYYNEPITNNSTYIRTVLHNNFWDMQSISTAQRGGTAIPEEVTLYIPWNDRYLRPDEFSRLDKLDLSKHWTIALGADLQATRILRGDIPFEFGWEQGDNFIRTYMRPFEREYDKQIRIVQDENSQLFGSRNLWHIVVRC